ncbi:MAG: RidA family protein [Planctomycetales bacterium]|nr:RidA family protein [Planctomycetales bacterium]
MEKIRRIGESARWADVLVYQGIARWVEVANDTSVGARAQLSQVFIQLDKTLQLVGSTRSQLLEVTIFLSDLTFVPILNELWDQWIDSNHPPIRACVQCGLQGNIMAEFVVHAAVGDG